MLEIVLYMAKSKKKQNNDKKAPVLITRSCVKMIDGKPVPFYTHAGSYNEVTKSAIGKFPGSSVGD
jgi:hypothetical protein